MICRECGAKIYVIDSRKNMRGDCVYRRRECKKCGLRISTYEQESDDSTIDTIREHLHIIEDTVKELKPLLRKML